MTIRLEAPTESISMARAAELAGLQPRGLQQAAASGRLVARKLPGTHVWLTSRKDLHAYLVARWGNVKPLPEGYKGVN